MTTAADSLARLHATLSRRDTPERVAEIAREALPRLSQDTIGKRLERLFRLSPHVRFGWSSMGSTFRAPANADSQIKKARELALVFLGQTLPDGADDEDLDAVAAELSRLIGRAPGKGRFDLDRMNGEDRRSFGLTLSRRRYDKLFRLVGRLEDKARRMRRERENAELVLVGKAALSPRLVIEDFAGHVPSAAFVAYLAARMKMRSEFTVSGQQKPFDEFAADLFALCKREPGASWWAIAHVFPRRDVLVHLTEEQKGRLLGQWFDILQISAERLAEAHERTAIDLDSMIVRRGNDSSTWNLLAGAYNRARDHWIALIEAMGAQAVFETMMPGKSLRLMAGDVAAWHRSVGAAVHPDTLVWRQLPKPWLVLRGEAECTRADIEAACLTEGVDPVKSGWSGARPRTAVAAYRPTPELVHGVAVANPYYAAYLRRIGAFSGKPLKTALLD